MKTDTEWKVGWGETEKDLGGWSFTEKLLQSEILAQYQGEDYGWPKCNTDRPQKDSFNIRTTRTEDVKWYREEWKRGRVLENYLKN